MSDEKKPALSTPKDLVVAVILLPFLMVVSVVALPIALCAIVGILVLRGLSGKPLFVRPSSSSSSPSEPPTP